MHLAARPIRRRPARPTSRVLAALLGVAFVLSSLIGLIHEASTPHVRCAEHGELIHGEPGAMVATAATSHATFERGVGVDGETNDHEHVLPP